MRSAVAEPVPIGGHNLPYLRYGMFFWSDRRHNAMMGHSGQQTLIEPTATGSRSRSQYATTTRPYGRSRRSSTKAAFQKFQR